MAAEHDICILSVERDAELAVKLADSIRRYRLPRGVRLREDGPDYRRILLECTGEEFTEEVRQRLRSSRFLVLLCSPETRDHPGILERLRYFRHTHGRESIIAALAEGEPVDSFPESFIEKKAVRFIRPDMTVGERIETIEPVAADLRADSPRRWREVLHYETVRIVASVLGMHPDALEQRHRSRRRKAIAAVLVAVGAVCLAAAAIFLRLGYAAKTEGDIAARQVQLSMDIARRTMEELPAAFADEPEALRYIDEAIASARTDLEELGLAELLGGEEVG